MREAVGLLLLAAAMLVSMLPRLARGEDGESRLLYFPVEIQQQIEPQPLVIDKPQLRDVVMLVPNFPCGACQWWEREVLSKVQGVRVIKRVDMDQPSWPRLVLPDRHIRNTWNYEHPQTRKPLGVADIELIIKAFPPDSADEKKGRASVDSSAAAK